MTDIRVLITDDDPLVRVALAHFVSRDPEISVVGQAENGKQAIEKIEELNPNIVMMDVVMPEMGGIEATKIIKKQWADIRVLAVTTLDSLDAVLPMLSSGATGYILKESTADEVLQALKQAFAGESPLSPRIASTLVQYVSATGPLMGSGGLLPLTERETEVLHCLARGMSNAEMADTLKVSEGTIKAHLGSIMSKWNVRDRVQVLVTAAREGLINFG